MSREKARVIRWKRMFLFVLAGFVVNAFLAAATSFLVITGDGNVGKPLVQASVHSLVFQQEIVPYKRRVMAYTIRHVSYIVLDDVEVSRTDHRRGFGWDAKCLRGFLVQPDGRRTYVFGYEERSAGFPMRSASGRLLEVNDRQREYFMQGMIPHPWSLHHETVGAFIWRPTLGAIPNSLFYAMILWLFVHGRSNVLAALRSRGGRCTACGYNLSNISSIHCPECGSDQSFRLRHRVG